MEIKEKYLQAINKNAGRLNEIDLGETIGLDENSTWKIINQLLSEYKIEFIPYGACNYSVIKQKTKTLK